MTTTIKELRPPPEETVDFGRGFAAAREQAEPIAARLEEELQAIARALDCRRDRVLEVAQDLFCTLKGAIT